MQDIREWNGKAYIDVIRVRRPFLSYTGRDAFFLFGKAKRKNGGRNTQKTISEQYLYTIYSIEYTLLPQ